MFLAPRKYFVRLLVYLVHPLFEILLLTFLFTLLYLQRSPFGAPFLSIVKTITMSEGEFDFDNNFALEPEGTTEGIAYPNTTFIIWLIFLVLMSLLLQNLLVSCI